MNPLRRLSGLGQSVWLDEIRRSMLEGGDLARLVEEDGLAGVTSNPAIFEKAIAGSADYRDATARLLADSPISAVELYERLAIADIRDAAGVLRRVWDATDGRDGFVSLEVSPHLAHDTDATVAEALRLWAELAVPNVMIKVPATPEGIPAIERLIAEGVNVNVTLLFSCDAYARVVDAYFAGLERRAARGLPLDRVASVASFFVSRIDTVVDRRVEELIAGADGAVRAGLERLMGATAIANAKMAFEISRKRFADGRWQALAARGARPQRLLWASTSTKNPAYRDVIYVEELIGPDTVNTLPPATLAAFRDHGEPRLSLEQGLDEARAHLDRIGAAGISLTAVTDQLLADGVRLFAEAFDRLLAAVEKSRSEILSTQVRPMRAALPDALAAAVRDLAAEWRETDGTRRLWSRDATLFTGADEASWLGWLDVAEAQRADLARLDRVAALARPFSHVLLLGMGGSSLAPEVLAAGLGPRPGRPELVVLDSTDPDQVRSVEARLDFADTLVVVASKSGTTLEPRLLLAWALDRLAAAVGPEQAPRRAVAITDPGSALEREARRRGFLAVLHGVPEIGGRFSALSDFGLAPAAMAGVDVAALLDRAVVMRAASGPDAPELANPGVALGLMLAAAARTGRDKLTLVVSPGIAGFADWLEQLVAESTGKHGRVILPIAGEPLGPPGVYGSDRMFVALTVDGEAEGLEPALDRLEAAGHPVLRIGLADRADLGAEFFRWQVATAVAGAVLRVNPFDQPDVEAAKVAARELSAAYETRGALPPQTPLAAGDGLTVFCPEGSAGDLLAAAGGEHTPAALVAAHLRRLQPGDYLALLAWLDRSPEHAAALDRIRCLVRDRRKVATTVGFGPRYLHSTGQAHKGGPGSGLYLLVTAEPAADLPLPGMRATFAVVEAAQALGDLAVLAERGRRVLRVHLGPDIDGGLDRLHELVADAVGDGV